MRAVSVVLFSALLVSACYTYVPTSTAPQRASEVRLQLFQPGEFRLANLTANDVVLIEGEMIRAGADSVLVSARWLQARSGYEFVGSGETVRVPRPLVSVIETKKLSPFKTAALAAGLVLTVGATSRIVGRTGDGGAEGKKGPPGEQ